MKPSGALRKYRSEIRDIVARHGAFAPRVFDSAVHGTDIEESDLDLLVDPSPCTTLMTLAAIQLDAEHLLGVHVDVLSPNSIPQRIRDGVLLEAIPARSPNSLAGFPNIPRIILDAIDRRRLCDATFPVPRARSSGKRFSRTYRNCRIRC